MAIFQKIKNDHFFLLSFKLVREAQYSVKFYFTDMKEQATLSYLFLFKKKETSGFNLRSQDIHFFFFFVSFFRLATSRSTNFFKT